MKSQYLQAHAESPVEWLDGCLLFTISEASHEEVGKRLHAGHGRMSFRIGSSVGRPLQPEQAVAAVSRHKDLQHIWRIHQAVNGDLNCGAARC